MTRRLNRQMWAVQTGGNFGDHDVPYNIRNRYGIVGIDAENGDIWLRARYNREILINPANRGACKVSGGNRPLTLCRRFPIGTNTRQDRHRPAHPDLRLTSRVHAWH